MKKIIFIIVFLLIPFYAYSADVACTALSAATLAGSECMALDQSGSAYNTSPDALKTYVYASPQLGGDAALNSNMLTEEFTACAGNNFTAGEIAYSSSGCMAEMDASTSATAAGAAAIALETINAEATGTFGVYGILDTSGLTAGSIYYSSTTAGAMDTTAPDQAGEVVRILGSAYTANKFFFNPDQSYVEN